MSGMVRRDAIKRADESTESLRRGAGVVPSPGGDATTPAAVALIREFIVGEVGFDNGVLMTDQAERLAAALAAAGVVSDAAAEVRALRDAADAAVPKFNVHPLNRSNTVREWLLDRADRIAAAAVSGVAASKADTDEAGA